MASKSKRIAFASDDEEEENEEEDQRDVLAITSLAVNGQTDVVNSKTDCYVDLASAPDMPSTKASDDAGGGQRPVRAAEASGSRGGSGRVDGKDAVVGGPIEVDLTLEDVCGASGKYRCALS